MAVAADFTADVEAGEPPLTVQFTDTSTGSPDRWLWDFGDGESSDEQHPEHIFNGAIGTKYTVKLKAWISGGENVIPFSNNPTDRAKSGGADSDNAAAWATYDANPWGAGTSGVWYKVTHLNPTPVYVYNANEATRDFNVPSSTRNISICECIFTDTNAFGAWNLEGIITSDIGGKIDTAGKALNTKYAFLDITSYKGAGWNQIGGLVDINNTVLTPPAHLDATGVSTSFTGTEYVINSADDWDEEEKVDFITMGVPPIANFSGAPTSGRNPLFVAFNNLSIPAVGGPTTYSWKKRVSGSGASYVEFSTAVNPVHVFDKDNP